MPSRPKQLSTICLLTLFSPPHYLHISSCSLHGSADTLPLASVETKTRTASSVSSVIEEEGVMHDNISTPHHFENVSDAGSDSIFEAQPSARKQHSRPEAPQSSNSSTCCSHDHSLTLQTKNSFSKSNTGISSSALSQDDSDDTSSISSLETNHISKDDDATIKTMSTGGGVSPSSDDQETPAVDMSKLSLVESPKECIKDGVPYVASPVPGGTVQSSHLAAPPSATSSSPSPASLSPSTGPHSSSAPTTPPVSPPPVPLKHATSSGPETDIGGGSYKWEELPSGKAVEVEVTWAPSPSNFTVRDYMYHTV